MSHDAHAVELDHHLERARIEEVADQHARCVAPQRIRGLPAAAKVGFVDDVVVQQRRGVDELDDRRGGDMVPAARATRARGEQDCERAQPLAAAADDVVGDLVDERDVAAEATDDRAVHVGPILTDCGPQSVERRDWRQGVGEGHAGRMIHRAPSGRAGPRALSRGPEPWRGA